jgi:hypothetical protein
MSINTLIACNQPLLFNVKQHVSACNWPSSGFSFSLKRKYIFGVGKGAEISTRLSPPFFFYSAQIMDSDGL